MREPGALPFNNHSSRRKAKIVCTIGPASRSEVALRDLMRLGMDVARLNFSHGTHDEHSRLIQRLRTVAKQEGRTICILQDLQGPKIRTGRLKHHKPVTLKKGSRVTITPRDIFGTASVISTTFKTLAQEVEPGARVLLSDGLIELRVSDIRGNDVECEVVNGGLLGEHKGINLPGTIVSVPSLTAKDEEDLEFGLKQGVDMVAASFIRTADDVRAVKRQVRDSKSSAWIVAKLENLSGVRLDIFKPSSRGRHDCRFRRFRRNDELQNRINDRSGSRDNSRAEQSIHKVPAQHSLPQKCSDAACTLEFFCGVAAELLYGGTFGESHADRRLD